MDDNHTPSTTRRGMMKGVGGFAALSMSNTTIAEAAEVVQQEEQQTDPHTLDTYRSIVDAIVPRTPELGEKLGEEHVPGGLAVELEKFIVYDFNHFQEIRLETLKTPLESNNTGTSDGAPAPNDLSGQLTETFDSLQESGLDPDERMPVELFETSIDATGSGSDLDALREVAPAGAFDGIDTTALESHFDLGALDRLEIEISNPPTSQDETGPADVEILVEAGNETVHRVAQNYQYAESIAFIFDLAAADFLARGENQDPPQANEQFAAGGTFVHLSREDRLRVLWDIVEGSFIDRFDEALSPTFPQLGIMKYVVMAVNGLHGFGYYTEWSAYGETKDNLPQERELAKPPEEAQSRTQTDYPGPRKGSRANWFHAVDGGFSDNPSEYEGDLVGDDVLSSDELEGNLGDSGGGDSANDGAGNDGSSGATDDGDGTDTIADTLGGDSL